VRHPIKDWERESIVAFILRRRQPVDADRRLFWAPPTAGGAAGTRTAVIVVHLDGTTASLRAWAYAAGVARQQDREVVCVQVLRQVPLFYAATGWGCPADTLEDQLSAQFDACEQDLAQITEDADAWGIRHRTMARAGHTATELRRVLKEEVDVSMLVVGAGTAAGRSLAFSMACRMPRRWPCPLVLVP